MMSPQEPWFPIRTERLLLRQVAQSDFDDVHAYAIDAAVVRYMTWGPNTLEETQAAIDRWMQAQAAGSRREVNLAVQHLADDRVIGSIRLATDEATATGNFGYSFHSAYWRQGLGTEAARAIVNAGFSLLGLRRIWAECDTRNAGSYGVMQKLGMRREAHDRQDKRSRDGWRDSYVYAVLAEEWNG